MWQIMWMFGLLPDWFWYLLLILSVGVIIATYFLRMIPFISANAVAARFAAIAVLLLSTWMSGGIANEAKWQARVDELEKKVAAAERQALEASAKIETVYVDRVQVVKEIQYVVKNQITKSANKLDANCNVIPEAIDILNQSTGEKK
jgi:hypothetical protein